MCRCWPICAANPNFCCGISEMSTEDLPMANLYRVNMPKDCQALTHLFPVSALLFFTDMQIHTCEQPEGL